MAPESSNTSNQGGGVPYRSKLVPYASEIAAWQREGEGMSFHAIAERLNAKYGLKVHPDTIYAFVRVRARGRKQPLLPEKYLPGQAAPVQPTQAAQPRLGVVSTKSLAPVASPTIKPPENTPAVPRQGSKMLPVTEGKKYISFTGKEVPPPPDPSDFRSENL
jgi:hypothetical protein